MLEQNYKVLTHCGMFVDERLLDKGIYTTTQPVYHRFDTTIDTLKENLKKYHSYLGGEYALPVALENLNKCNLHNAKTFITISEGIHINEKDLLPSHYEKVDEIYFQGRGNHSVNELEDIAENYKELVHQLRVREQAILKVFSCQIVR